MSNIPEASASPPPRLVISLATYNEAENVEPLVAGIRDFAPDASILIIDDNSPDGTGAIAERLAGTLKDVAVIHRAGKLGLGTATLEAMAYAIRNGFDYLLNMDVPGGGVEGEFNLKRKFMSTGINMYARTFLGLKTRDNSGAFRCYRVSKLAQIDFTKVRSRGYSFQEEILFWCRQVGCRFGETPILFENRRAGMSKINSREAAAALWIIFRLGLGRLLGRV